MSILDFWRKKSAPAPQRDELARLIETIEGMDNEEAKSLFQSIAARGTTFQLIPGEHFVRNDWPKSVQDVFSNNDRFICDLGSFGNIEIRRSNLFPFEDSNHLYICEDFDGGTILAHSITDGIYEMYDASDFADLHESSRFPTIYHWLIGLIATFR